MKVIGDILERRAQREGKGGKRGELRVNVIKIHLYARNFITKNNSVSIYIRLKAINMVSKI